ncbi:MAG TPA: hypothetical protein VND21_00915, partial [Planctomycetota bacterium]|nr:hypothetical protein [Planctomycetota bacterium]
MLPPYTAGLSPLAPDDRALPPPPPLADAVEAAFARGRLAHPALEVARATYAERVVALTRRVRVPGVPAASPAEAATVLRRAAHGDLYLAVACETGAGGAWEALTTGYRG